MSNTASTATTLTPRERWLRVLRYQDVDRLPDEEFGYWGETLRRWHGEGLPATVTNDWEADNFFGFDQRAWVPFNAGLIPCFDYEVLQDMGERRIVRQSNGVVCEIFSEGTSSIPRYIDYPIKDRATWEAFKHRLDPAAPGRLPDNLRELAPALQATGWPIGVQVGSLIGLIRDWTGFENLCLLTYDDPALVEEMIETMTQLALVNLPRILEAVPIDFAHFWEDIAFRGGPILSPAMFRRWLVPRYRRITDLLRAHGVEFISLDCDGDITELVPCWLDGGVNIMFPLEVRGGSDPVALRRKFGKDCLLIGGVDKTALIAGRAAIDRELERLRPLMDEGGYIPHVDHRVPPDISYDDYCYYIEQKRKLLPRR